MKQRFFANYRCFNTEYNALFKNNKLLDENVAYETEYYYKQVNDIIDNVLKHYFLSTIIMIDKYSEREREREYYIIFLFDYSG